MKEFLVGLLALLLLLVMLGTYYLLFPFFMVLAIFLRVIIAVFLIFFSIWLLGKVIITLFDMLGNKK